MTKRMIVAALALAGIFLAIFLLLYKLGMVGELSCSIGSCEKVNTSRWATFLGLPVAAWGVGWYISVFVLALVATGSRYAESAAVSLLLLVVAAGGFVFTAYLTYLELFVIGAICQWCVVSAVLVAIILALCAADYRDKGRAASM